MRTPTPSALETSRKAKDTINISNVSMLSSLKRFSRMLFSDTVTPRLNYSTKIHKSKFKYIDNRVPHPNRTEVAASDEHSGQKLEIRPKESLAETNHYLSQPHHPITSTDEEVLLHDLGLVSGEFTTGTRTERILALRRQKTQERQSSKVRLCRCKGACQCPKGSEEVDSSKATSSEDRRMAGRSFSMPIPKPGGTRSTADSLDRPVIAQSYSRSQPSTRSHKRSAHSPRRSSRKPNEDALQSASTETAQLGGDQSPPSNPLSVRNSTGFLDMYMPRRSSRLSSSTGAYHLDLQSRSRTRNQQRPLPPGLPSAPPPRTSSPPRDTVEGYVPSVETPVVRSMPDYYSPPLESPDVITEYYVSASNLPTPHALPQSPPYKPMRRHAHDGYSTEPSDIKDVVDDLLWQWTTLKPDDVTSSWLGAQRF